MVIDSSKTDRPEGAFVTVVPKEFSGFRNIIRELPEHSEELCEGCKVAPTCSNTIGKVPLQVWDLLPQEHHCPRFDRPVATCWVVPWVDMEPEPLPDSPMYLVDTNVFLNAYNGDPDLGDVSWWVLKYGHIRIATTTGVVKEAWDTKGYKLPGTLEVFEVGQMDPRLAELRPPRGCKEPSFVDLGLMQAVLDNGEIRGIITFDQDFQNIAGSGNLSNWTGRKIEIMDPFELKKKMVK